MRIIEKDYEPSKMVNFWGLELDVPASSRALSADNDGRVYSYTKKPKMKSNGTEDYWSGNGFVLIVRVDLEGMDWKKTLVEL